MPHLRARAPSRRRCGTAAGPGSGRRWQRSAAAASTPSGAPPSPCRCRCRLVRSEVAITPATSPSLISLMRAPGLAHLGDQLGMARPVEDADDELGDVDLLGLGEVCEVLRRRLVEIDDALGQAAADGDLVHVDVGRIEEAAVLGHGDDGQRIGQTLGGDGRALERIERDVDLGAPAWPARPSRRCRASAPRRARPRRSRRCRRWRASRAPCAWRRPPPGRPPSRRRGPSAWRRRAPPPR